MGLDGVLFGRGVAEAGFPIVMNLRAHPAMLRHEQIGVFHVRLRDFQHEVFPAGHHRAFLAVGGERHDLSL